jgi:hypothetical protein
MFNWSPGYTGTPGRARARPPVIVLVVVVVLDSATTTTSTRNRRRTPRNEGDGKRACVFSDPRDGYCG